MLKKKFIFFIPVIIAIIILLVLKQNKKQPVRNTAEEKVTHVRVISVPSVAVIPQVIGYGTVQPSRNWRAVSQVKGKIVYKNTKLKKGNIIATDELLIKIDPTDYQLSITRTQADIASIDAQLSELGIKQKNTQAALKIEKQSLTLINNELQRLKKLSKNGGISFSDVEKQERSYLVQQQVLQNQRNTLNLIPSQKAVLDAQLLRQQTQLKSLQRDLANTQIKLPFSGRVAQVNIEQDQYIREGELLITVDSLDKAEIEVQLPLTELKSIMYSDKILDNIINPNASDQHKHDIQALVSLKLGDRNVDWKARFARLSGSLDPKTRTVGVIVEVDKPYTNIQPGVRPPLVKGLFVSVKLTGSTRKESIIVPNSAIHSINGQKVVYLINHQRRLEIRPVSVKIIQDEYTIINHKIDNSGLQAGEQLIISDLLPAIKNMLLTGQEDELLSQRIIQQATHTND